MIKSEADRRARKEREAGEQARARERGEEPEENQAPGRGHEGKGL